MSNQPRLYRLFHMNMASDIPIPEATPAAEGAKPDAVVQVGKVPDAIRAANEASGEWWFGVVSRQELWFRSPHALYHVQNGSHVMMEPFEGATEADLRLFLLGSALGFLMIQRGWFPVHGGSVVIGGRAAILTGDTGTGKSTLTSAVVEQGCSFLADDVSSVAVQDGKPLVMPAYPQRKLCIDAVKALGYDPDQLVLISQERQKYGIRDDSRWCGKPLPLGCMVEIIPSEVDVPSIERVTGHKSMALFLKNLYRSFIYQFMGVAPASMKTLLGIVSATPVYRLARPAGLAHTDAIVQALFDLPME